MLASKEQQLKYERALKKHGYGHAPTELICMFCDDMFHPQSDEFIASFNDDEINAYSGPIWPPILKLSGHLY